MPSGNRHVLNHALPEDQSAVKRTHRVFQRQISAFHLAQLEKTRRVSLGIAICGALTEPGQVRTLGEIAAFADCTMEAIRQIEAGALRKLRERFANDPDLNAYLRK